MEQKTITVSTSVNVPVEKAWDMWTTPEHIKKWNYASDDWHTPYAKNDLKTGGRFESRMEAKDGSMGFDFGGVYDEVIPLERISYTMDDGRKVFIHFSSNNNSTAISEQFETENTNSAEMQRGGWQAIIDNFKKYAESQL